MVRQLSDGEEQTDCREPGAAADDGWRRRPGQEPRLVAQRVLRQHVRGVPGARLPQDRRACGADRRQSNGLPQGSRHGDRTRPGGCALGGGRGRPPRLHREGMAREGSLRRRANQNHHRREGEVRKE